MATPQDHLTKGGETRPRFYFVDEAATELRRSEASVRWLIHTKQIRTGKLAGRIIIAADEIERLINEAFEPAAS